MAGFTLPRNSPLPNWALFSLLKARERSCGRSFAKPSFTEAWRSITTRTERRSRAIGCDGEVLLASQCRLWRTPNAPGAGLAWCGPIVEVALAWGHGESTDSSPPHQRLPQLLPQHPAFATTDKITNQ